MLTSNYNYKEKTVKELKANARGQLIGKYGIAIFISLTVVMIELVVTSISDSAYTGSTLSYLLRYAISLVIDLLMGVLVYGEARFFLNLVRGKEPLMLSDLFYGFKNNMDKSIMIQGVFTLVSFAVSIPAVFINLGFIVVDEANLQLVMAGLTFLNILALFIAKLFCGLSFFILNDEPDLSVSEVLHKSMELMKNKKGKYILTCLSLIPIMILSVLAFVVGVAWYAVYRQAVITNFYLDAISEEPVMPSESSDTHL